MRIVLTGAGSAGHIYPLVAVAQELKAQQPDIELLYIGTKSQMHALADDAMTENDIPIKNVMTGKMRRYFSWHYFADFFRVPIGIIQSLWMLLIFMPDAVFSKGGYASVPVVLAAWVYRIPVLTHESDVTPGWANRVNGKFARFVALTFPEAARYFVADKTVVTGDPMRLQMKEGDAERGRTKWEFGTTLPVIFVFGGSQGAGALNTAVTRALPEITKFAQIIHVAGPGNYDDTRTQAGKAGFRGDGERYVLKSYLEREDMADAYALADLVIARPGSSTITEIAANAKPSILVPHPQSANDHQRMNAFSVAEAGATLVLDEGNLGEHIFTEKVEMILRSNSLRDQFSKNIIAFYRPDAAPKIVAGIMQMLK